MRRGALIRAVEDGNLSRLATFAASPVIQSLKRTISDGSTKSSSVGLTTATPVGSRSQTRAGTRSSDGATVSRGAGADSIGDYTCSVWHRDLSRLVVDCQNVRRCVPVDQLDDWMLPGRSRSVAENAQHRVFAVLRRKAFPDHVQFYFRGRRSRRSASVYPDLDFRPRGFGNSPLFLPALVPIPGHHIPPGATDMAPPG
jgi:hypothetical protein